MELIALKLLKTFGLLFGASFGIGTLMSIARNGLKAQNNWNEADEKSYSVASRVMMRSCSISIIVMIASAILYIWS